MPTKQAMIISRDDNPDGSSTYTLSMGYEDLHLIGFSVFGFSQLKPCCDREDHADDTRRAHQVAAALVEILDQDPHADPGHFKCDHQPEPDVQEPAGDNEPVPAIMAGSRLPEA